MLAADHPFLAFGEWRAFAAVRSEGVIARVVASVDARQLGGPDRIGCIGFIRDSPGSKASPGGAGALGRVMAAAARWLRGRGAYSVRCPVQLSTWYGHRAVTSGFPECGGEPWFALEPRSTAALLDVLAQAGFAPAHRAVSCAVSPAAVVSTAQGALTRLERAGLRARPLRASSLDDELALLHSLSTRIFEGSWGISPISLAEFDALYRPLAHGGRAPVVRILETRDGHALGFGFAVSEGGSSSDDATVARRAIVKSVGVLPDARRRYPGVGIGLVARIHAALEATGVESAVHALMAQGSMAHRLSLRWGHPIRSYATFDRHLP